MSKKHYPMRIPRYAKGIRAQELRTGAGRSWWEKRWLASLESKNLNGRLGRGRNYALTGQVTEMKIEGPHVEAKVVGTRDEPYRVTVDFRIPEGAARERIVAALRSEPMLVARMLADDLPTEVEAIFKAEGYDLFPGGKLTKELPVAGCRLPEKKLPVDSCQLTEEVATTIQKQKRETGNRQPATGNQQPIYDMTTRCSCPDYANPCKHSGAVLLILGEEIARRPMLLVELRGIRMEELYKLDGR